MKSMRFTFCLEKIVIVTVYENGFAKQIYLGMAIA